MNSLSLFEVFLLAFSLYQFKSINDNVVSLETDPFYCKDPTPFEIFMSQGLELTDVGYEQCNLCNFTVRNEAQDSTPDDLIIGVALRHISNENFFARTIRTTGSKCRIVFVCDDIAIENLPKERYDDAVKCGVQFSVVPSKSWNGDYFSLAAAAYYYVLAFLLRNRGRFYRIIFQDLFDSVFQGDPFTTDLVTWPNEIHATHEFLNGWCNYMVTYYKKAGITQPKWYGDRYFKNSSHFGAFAETMIKFLLVFVSVNNFAMGWNDQITANYILFNGDMERYGLYYSNDTKLERFINLVNNRERNQLPNFHAHFSNNNQYAVSVHHTWQRKQVMLNIVQICPIKERDPKLVRDYFGKCNDGCFRTIMNYLNNL